MKISDSKLSYYRMAGYTVTILMHTINTYVMMGNFRADIMDDPNIQLFAKFMYKFITCWTFVAQTIHAILGMSCEVLTWTGGQYKFLKHVKQGRDILFAGIVLPFTLLVASCFWPIFLYDRELVLPYYTTKIVGTLSNHVMHTAIVPATLWELVFQPRQTPSSHKQNAAAMVTYAAIYLAVIFKTFTETGVFPYPVMTMLYGSVYFVILLAASICTLPIYYFAQWPLTRLLWKEEKEC